MLIRSQDKETLINFNNSIVVNTMVDIGGVTKMFCSYSCDDYVIGHYSSKEKAMKVLDMIQEAYTNGKVAQILSYGLRMVPTEEINEAGKIIKNAIQSSTVFQIPEDSEVEV